MRMTPARTFGVFTARTLALSERVRQGRFSLAWGNAWSRLDLAEAQARRLERPAFGSTHSRRS